MKNKIIIFLSVLQGPMMRPQHSMYMQHSAGGPRSAMGAYGGPMGPGGPQRPPNVQVAPDGMPMGSQQEWRHMMMQQQQMGFSGGPGPGGPMRQGAGGFNSGKLKFDCSGVIKGHKFIYYYII